MNKSAKSHLSLKRICCYFSLALIILAVSSVNAFALSTTSDHKQNSDAKIQSNLLNEKEQNREIHQLRQDDRRYVRNYTFVLKDSLAGWGNNVITSNLFDCVPSFNGAQQWKNGNSRLLKAKPGSWVTVTGCFYYRDLFGGMHLKEFSRRAYVPKDYYTVIIK